MEDEQSFGVEANGRTNEGPMPSPEELYEKAAVVHARMTELRERIDKTVFVGASEDGLLKIGMCGDGSPASVEFLFDVPEDAKKAFENEVLEALIEAHNARVEELENGLKAIQEETGTGPDFRMPF